MKQRLQGIIIGALVVVLMMCATGLAKDAAESITAVYRNIKLVVDGVLIEPKDANGQIVEPFIYNGTTYLPVRAVGEAFNKQVEWDGNENTVFLGGVVNKPAKELTIWNRPYLEVSDATLVETTSKDGVGFIKFHDKWSKAKEIADGRKRQVEWVKYPLNSLAKSISGEFYMTGVDSAESVLRILDSNGRELYESPIMREAVEFVKFDVNVENEISVTFEVEYTSAYSNGSTMYIENPIVVSADY